MSTNTIATAEKERIVHGSLWLAIWDMSWPILLNMCIWGVGAFVDTWVAGRLDADAQAAMGIGFQIRYFMMMLTMAMVVGTIAIVSRYFGAGDIENAVEASKQSLIFAGIFGIFSVVVGYIACRSLLYFLGASIGVQTQGWNFLQFAILCNFPSTLFWISQSIFRAIGAPRIATATSAWTVVLIMLLDILLCIWPFHIGVGGIGLSWCVGSSIGFICNAVKLGNSEVAGCLQVMESLRKGISWQWFSRFMKIGLPGCMQDIAVIVASFGLFNILSHTVQPTINQAAWSIGWRIEEIIVFLPMCALNLAIATIVGQNMGAGQARRAEESGWKMAYIAAGVNILIGLVLWVFASNIANLLTTDPAIAAVSADYLRIVSWSEPFVALSFVFSGAMQGAGYSRWPMAITVICFDILRLTAALLFTVNFNKGANGTWIAMAATSVLSGILMLLLFKYSRWKQQLV